VILRACSGFAGAAALLATLATAVPAQAAWETEVLTAVERHRTLPDLDLGVTWDRLQKRGKITREWIQEDNGALTALDVKELRYTEITQRLLMQLRVGIYHDLEFHVTAPLVLQSDSDIRFSAGVSGRSTIFGSPNADDPAYAYRFPITDVPAARERSGFGDMTFGLAWSPVVDTKDEAYPTMTLRADVIAPTGKTRVPTDPAALAGGSGGGVGTGSTSFDFSLGLSRRMRTELPTFDPYMIFGAMITVAGPEQKARGYEPPPSARFLVGTEILLDEDVPTDQRYAIDLSFGVRYIGIGRTYSELSDYLPNFDQTLVPGNRDAGSGLSPDAVGYDDYANADNYATRLDGAACGRSMRADGTVSGIEGVPCGELNRVDEHLELQSTLAFHIRPSKYALFRAGIGFGLDTDHFLTTERVGTDTDPASAEGQICGGSECVGRVNAVNSRGEDERSPYYDPRYDAPGRRLRIEETTLFTLFFTGMLTF
jgi:hypothetical protein